MRSVGRPLSCSIVLTEVVATACQFFQRTDPRFPLVYFTVCSGVLAGAIALGDALGRREPSIEIGRIAAAVGVVLSAVIFAAIIAPATATGTWFQPWDDPWVRAATALFHGLAPVLVIARLILNSPTRPLRNWIAAANIWALLYFGAIALAATMFHVKVPYPFLSPSQMGWATVLAAVAALCAGIVLITSALYLAARTIGHPRQDTSLSPP